MIQKKNAQQWKLWNIYYSLSKIITISENFQDIVHHIPYDRTIPNDVHILFYTYILAHGNRKTNKCIHVHRAV